MSNSENTKFKELSLEDQLDLVSYVLQGNTLSYRRSECENFSGVVNNKPTVLTFKWDHMFKKNPSRLENLIKQKEALEEEIASLKASHSNSLTGDKPLCTQSPSEEEKACEKDCVESESYGERITLENWKGLLKEGQSIICKDEDEGSIMLKTVTSVEEEYYDGVFFMGIDGDWVWFDRYNICGKGFSYYVKK